MEGKKLWMQSRLSKFFGKCFGGNCQSDEVTKTHIAPSPPSRRLPSHSPSHSKNKSPYPSTMEREDVSDTDSDPEVDTDGKDLAPTLPLLEANIKARISETVNFTSPESFEPRGKWKCEPNLRLCIPHTAPLSPMPAPTIEPLGPREDYQWNACQEKCGADYNHSKRTRKWQRSTFLNAQQHFFLATMLKNLIASINGNLLGATGGPPSPMSPMSPTETYFPSFSSSSSPPSTKTSTSDEHKFAEALETKSVAFQELPETAGEMAMTIRIIFSLASIPPEHMATVPIEDILVAMINLHWPPMYEIALLLGVSKEQIFNAAIICIEVRLFPLREIKSVLQENLKIETLNHNVVTNMKKLKVCLHEYLSSHAKFIDVAILVAGAGGAGEFLHPMAFSDLHALSIKHKREFIQKNLPKTMYKTHKEKLRGIFLELKELCRGLIVHASEILSKPSGDRCGGESTKLDAFIMNGGMAGNNRRMECDYLDPMALDFAITIRLTAKEITNLIQVFAIKFAKSAF